MKGLPQRFYSLDVLRGLAALAVVVVHWGDFFVYKNPAFDVRILPLYSILEPVYALGSHAVDLFFCLSGFIFFWLYSEKIKSQATSPKEFAILRFSRLYPLHLATLLAVAIGQMMMWHSFGAWFACGNNDVKHFISQLFFASALVNNSFNHPTWSVSVEILLYGIFFTVCRLNWARWWQLIIYAGLGQLWVMHPGTTGGIARGVLSFFLGGLSFQIFLFLWKRNLSRRRFIGLGIVVMLLWLLIPWEVALHFPFASHHAALDYDGSKIVLVMRKAIYWSCQGGCELILFPLTIATLAVWESRRGTLGRRIAVLGDISYSTYMLHFPLQIVFALVALYLGWSWTIFSSPLLFFMFFAVLISLSLGSHYYFERPAQSMIRTWWLKPKIGKKSAT